MHREYILLNGFRKAKKGFTAGFHVPLRECRDVNRYIVFYSQVRTTMEISLNTVILGVVYILYMYVWNI